MKTTLIILSIISSLNGHAKIFGDYVLKSGDSSCKRNLTVKKNSKKINNKTYSGISLVESHLVGSMFEDTNSEYFLNFNLSPIKEIRKNSSFGTKYISKSISKLKGTQSNLTISKSETVKEFNIIYLGKTKYFTKLNFSKNTLKYFKSVKSENNWTRTCIYKK